MFGWGRNKQGELGLERRADAPAWLWEPVAIPGVAQVTQPRHCRAQGGQGRGAVASASGP